MTGREWYRTGLRLTIGLFLFFMVIEGLSRVTALPGLVGVFSGIGQLASGGQLSHDVSVSAARWVVGWIVGSAVGIAFGIITGRSLAASTALEGLFVLLRAVPFIALVPITQYLSGVEESGKFFLVGWASASVAWVVMHEAAKSLPQQLLWRAQSFGTPPLRWTKQVLLPSLQEDVYTALRTSLSLGLIVVAVAEMSGVYERTSGRWWSEGLGYRIFRAYDTAQDEQMLAAILLFALLGIALDVLFIGVWTGGRRMRRYIEILRLRRMSTDIRVARPDLSAEACSEISGATIEVTDLSAGYESPVLSGVSERVDSGETLVIVGRSGCGKTTFLRALGGFGGGGYSDTGVIRVDGETRSRSVARLGVVFQESPVFEHMTVWKNAMFGITKPNATDRDRVLGMLDTFGLAELLEKRASELSGGQKQRLALVSALAHEPQVLLLDEPFGALDALTRRDLQAFFWTYVRGKVTAVLVTHDIDEALILGDRIRVGLSSAPEYLGIDTNGLPPEQWSVAPDFVHWKRKLVEALNETKA